MIVPPKFINLIQIGEITFPEGRLLPLSFGYTPLLRE
jgi:hypothetical protein